MTDAEFQAAFDEHKDAVYRFAWRMCASPAAAEDITQNVFVGLLRHPDRFDPARGTMRAFLLGIARNLALKHWRAEHRFEPLDDEAFVAEPVDLDRGAVGDIVGRAVRALRATLKRNRIPFVEGKTWTTDAIFRETRGKILRRAEGALARPPG